MTPDEIREKIEKAVLFKTPEEVRERDDIHSFSISVETFSFSPNGTPPEGENQ